MMKRYIRLLGILFVALTIVNCGFAQEVITTVADGTATNMRIPVFGSGVSTPQHQQVVYPSDMLTDMVGGTVSSMTFYVSSVPVNAWNCSFSIRLGTSDVATFSSSTLMPVDNTVEVFSGLMPVDATNRQITIVFTQPYTYTGGNLLLDVQNSAEGTNSASNFIGINPGSNRSLCVFETGGNAFGLMQQFIPKTTFVHTGGASCLTPTDMTVLETNATSATVSWSAQTPGTQFQVLCDTAVTDLSSANWILTSDTFFTFSDLTPNASYVALVRSYCGSQTSSVAGVTFYTDCDGIVSEFPWSEGFENSWTPSYVFGQQNSSPQCWKMYNGGTTEHNSGTGAFYWKANTSAAQVHSGQRSAVCYTDYALARHNDWLVSPMFNLTGEQRVTFYVQNNTENTTKVDEISVWISDENAVLQAPTSDTAALPGFTQLFQTEIPVGSFRSYEVSLAGFSGHRYIAFVRRNEPNAGWYLCLDDITVEDAPPCAFPANLNAVSSAYEAQLSWVAEAEYYNLYYKRTSDSVYVSIPHVSLNNDSVYVLSGLTPATSYQWYVEAICGDQSLVPSEEISSFNTACVLIADVPQTWDFENNNFGGTATRPLPACWERKGNLVYPYIFDNQYIAYSGHACLHSGGEVANATAVLPQIDVSALPLNTLQIRFFAKHVGGSDGTIEVGLMSDPSDNSTFVSVHTIQSLTGNFEEYKVSLAHVQTTAPYIVMRMTPNDGDIYIDDLVLEKIPPCDRPAGLSCSNITSNSATVTWSSSAEASNVYVQEAGSGAFVLTEDSPVTGTSYTFNNLTPNTLYGVYVASVCDSIEIASSVLSFTSDCIALDNIPYTWDFESNNTSGVAAYPMQACWNRLNAGVTSMYVSNVSVMAHSGSHSVYSIYPNDYVLVMPTIDTSVLSLNNLQLSFYAKTNYGRNATLEVGVITDPLDPTTFESLETIQLTINHSLYEVVFSYYSGFANHLAFRLNSYNDYIVIDDVTLDAAPPCPKPIDFQCVSMSADAVSLIWEPGSDEVYWNVVYGTHGFNPDTASYILMFDSNYAYINDLTNSVSYDFYVRADCGDEDGVSGWLGLYNITPGSFFMQRQGIDTLYTCGAVIYDDGGPEGNYSNNCNSYLTIFPDTEYNYIEINGLLTAESSMWDYLVIYDGAGTANEVYRSTQDGSGTIAIPTITSTTGPLTIYFHSDNSVQQRGFAIYTTCVSCVAPNLAVSAVGLDSITLSWTQMNAISYELAYGPEGFDPDAVQTFSLTDVFSYTVSNLVPDTTLEFRIRTHCDENSYSMWSDPVQVSTLPYQPATLPYSCNFENGIENAFWTISNGSQTNAWYINTAVNNTVNGEHALYISMDRGLTNTYQNTETSVVWAYRDIQFPEANEFLLSFDWRCLGEGGGSYLWDYLSVYIGNPVRKEAGDESEPQGTVLLDNLLLKDAWSVAEYVLGSEYSNTTKRLYFVWRNDNSSGANPPAAIDNISLRVVNCSRPLDLTVENVTSTTATVSVTSTDEGEIAWQLKYGNNMIVTVTDSVYELTGLIPATSYEVCARSICANGDTSRWTFTYEFITGCVPIGSSDIPYSCGFEGDNYGGTETYPLPTCWSRLGSESFPYVDAYAPDAYSGSKSLVSGNDPSNYIVVLPEINASEISVNTLRVSFYARLTGYSGSMGSIEVGVMTNADDSTSFVPLDIVSHLTSTYKEYELSLETYEGHGTYLALRLNAAGSEGEYGYYMGASIFIDSVVVDYMPSCRRPDDLVNVNNTPTSVTVTWTPKGQEEQWAVAIGDYGFDPNETGFVHLADTNVLKLENLVSGTIYDVYVRANCDADGYSVWYGPLTVVPGIIYMGTSGVDTVYACDVTIYDDGGPFENYSDNCEAYLVVYPEQPGQFVQISGSVEIENHYYDYMEILDGTTNQLLYVTQNEQSELFNIPTIVSPTGPLTIHFHSDYSMDYAGFMLDVACVSCISPELTLNSFYTDSAVISWTGSSIYSNYQLVYGVQGFSPSVATPIEVSNATSYTITELTPNVAYDVYVRIQCDGDLYGNWSNVLSFTTLPGEPARLPYACDFENAVERNAWTLVNGSQSNRWYADVLEEGNKLYVSGDGGQTNTYVYSESSAAWAYRDFLVDASAELVLSFDWRCAGEGMYGASYDYLKLFFGDPVPIQAGSIDLEESITQVDLLNMEDSWTEAEYSLGNVEGGAVKRLYFLWHNDYTEGWDPAAAIDNIEIKAIHCAQPVDLRVLNVTPNSVSMAITYPNESVIGWQLQYGDNDPITVMGDSVIEVTNLNQATEYEFFARSICDNGDTSAWISYSVITDCYALTGSDLPYYCDFESNNLGGSSSYPLPACWQRTNLTYPYVDVFSYGAHSGIRYLYSGEDANDMFVVLPQINTAVLSIDQLQLGFYAKLSNFEGSIDVGVMTDPTNTMTFVPVGTISALSYEYIEYEVSLEQYTGNGSYIAMRLNSRGGLDPNGDYMYSLLYVDDITLGFIPDCSYPTNLDQSNFTAQSADLTWSDVADSYILYYREVGTTDYMVENYVTLTNGIYTLSGLNPSTAYEWYVASVCSNGSVVPSHIIGTFSTLCVPVVDYPYQETFNNGLGCWVSSVVMGEDWQWQVESEYGDFESPIGPAEGSHYVKAYWPGSGNIFRLTSPVFDLSSLDEPYIKFFHVQLDWTGDLDYLKIYYKSSPEVQPVLLAEYTTTIYPWQLDSLALPNPSANYQLLFDAYLNWGYGVGVDNVIVYDRNAVPDVELPVVVTNAVSDITENSAVLHGTITDSGNQTITSRGFEWKLSDNGTYAQVPDAGTDSDMTYLLSGLIQSTSYTYRAFVTTADTVVYGAEILFTTLENIVPCETPADLQVSNVTSTSAEVSWTAGGGEDTWVVEYKQQGTSEWQVQSVNTTQVTLADLTPSSTYMVRVKSVCDEEESSYVTTSFVTTVGICNVYYEQYIQLMPNPADEYIDLWINSNVEVKEALIYNPFGQLVQIVVLTDNHARIDLGGMVSGMFFVRVRHDQGVITKKFIKR
ncbi:MAG: fibronectin type III domain-containing protein [Bacteroidales bacterium]|nr:fibronectin type III domain-containing protein [Bacteroidales bacterium]